MTMITEGVMIDIREVKMSCGIRCTLGCSWYGEGTYGRTKAAVRSEWLPKGVTVDPNNETKKKQNRIEVNEKRRGRVAMDMQVKEELRE